MPPGPGCRRQRLLEQLRVLGSPGRALWWPEPCWSSQVAAQLAERHSRPIRLLVVASGRPLRLPGVIRQPAEVHRFEAVRRGEAVRRQIRERACRCPGRCWERPPTRRIRA